MTETIAFILLIICCAVSLVIFLAHGSIRKYRPIRIHHIYYSYGWWWGERFYFFNHGLYIVDMAHECLNAEYADSGKIVGHGYTHSWDRLQPLFP